MASEKNKLVTATEGVETKSSQPVDRNSTQNALSPSLAEKSHVQRKRRVVTFGEDMKNSTTATENHITTSAGETTVSETTKHGQSNGHTVTATDFQTPKINELPSTPPQDTKEIERETEERLEKRALKKMSVCSNGSQRDGPSMFGDFTIDGPVSVDELENKTSTLKHKWSFSITKSIPSLPMPVAVTCLVLNVLLPGSGTIISGFASLCLCEDHHQSEHRLVIAMVNVFVGIAQMSTVFFLLIGWMWSLLWGFALVGLATRYRRLSPDTETSAQSKNNKHVVDEDV